MIKEEREDKRRKEREVKKKRRDKDVDRVTFFRS